MPCASLQRKLPKFQEESSDLETQLLELGFLCENSDVADPDALLEAETFTTATDYDALNRATSIRTPHNSSIPASEILPGYNEASLLEKVDVKLRGAATATNFVQNIDYNAKGQRERIQYGNGSTTGYTYDEKTFRLKRLLTTRNNGADILQDLNYTYDAAGNVAQIDDAAQQTIFFNGSVVSPSQKFEYDAMYRLVKATGREHVSVNADGEPEAEGYNAAQISPQDGTAMRNYAREWEYDSVGNILSIIHRANGNAWTRTNAYATDSNRLTSSTVGSTSASFAYNAHGSMASMPHLSAMDWDFAEKLCHITRGTTDAYYNYDGNGIRTRKVVEKNGVVETRLYLGGFEIWRKTVNGVLDTECETLHVMDDQKRIAIVETLTVENGNRVAAPAPVQRYQLDNHLGSASLELDDSANIISYEEYYPYGDTSYRAGRNASEVSRKRYRYTGKEKDEESSLYYCEQRYYAAHISRWVSTDPTWLEDGINLYAYVHGNPVSGVDPSGTQTVDDVEIEKVKNSESSSDSKIASASSSIAEELSSLSYGGFDFQTKELRDQFQSYVENKFINDVIIANGFDIPLPLFRDESGQDVLQNSAVGKKLESSRENAYVQKTQEWLENNYQTIWKEARKLQGLPNDSEAYMWFMAGKKSKTMIEEGTKQMALGALTELAGVGLEFVGLKILKSSLFDKNVYRVFGGDARAQGFSWTDINPTTVSDYRNLAGLPSGGASGSNNTAEFMIVGRVNRFDIIESRQALPLDGNIGGLNEHIINPEKVKLFDFSILKP